MENHELEITVDDMSSEGKHDQCVYKIYLFMYVFITKYVMDLEYIKKKKKTWRIQCAHRYKLYSSSQYNYHFIILKKMHYLVFLG